MVFKVGDLVKLKSGGPVMTVAAIGEKGWIHCRWFIEQDVRKEPFPPESILKVDANGAPVE